MANMVAQGLGGHEEVLKNPEVDDIDKTLSSCFDHKDIYHVSLRDDSHSQTPDDIADLILRVATDDKPHFRYQTSQVTKAVAELFYKDITGDSFIDYQYEELKAFKEKLEGEQQLSRFVEML